MTTSSQRRQAALSIHAQLRSLLQSYWTAAGKRAAWNLAGLSVCLFLSQLCGLCLLYILTRALEAKGFGALSFALGVQSYLLFIGSLTSGAPVIREISRRPGDVDSIFTAYVLLTGVSSSTMAVFSVFVACLVPLADDERWLLILAAIGTIPGSMSVSPFFEVSHRQALGAVVPLLCEMLMLSATAYLDSREALTLPNAGMLFLGKWLLVFVAQWTLFQRAVRRLRCVYSPAELRGLFRSSWPIMLAALAFVAPLNSGTLLVRWFDSLEHAGVYGVAFQVANAYYLFGGLGVQIVQPHILGKYGLEPTFVRKLAIFVVGFVSGGGLLAGLGGWVLVHYLLDASYHSAATPLAFLLLAAGGMLASRFAHPYLVRFGAERVILIIHLVSSGLLVATSLLSSNLLTPASTAAIAVAASILAAALCLAAVRRRMRRGDQKAPNGLNGA